VTGDREQVTAQPPGFATGARRSGCPVIRLDTVRDRPVGEWMADLNELRRAGPIHWNERGRYWVITTASLAREVFQNPVVFTNDSISPVNPNPPFRWIPSNVNPPLHVQYRQLLNSAFGPAPVARIEPKAREYCRAAIDEIVDAGRCDFVADVGGLFPTRVFLELVDLPWQDATLFLAWTETLFDVHFTGPEARVAFDESRQYFVDLIAERRRAPRDPDNDFVSRLLTATIDGQPMPDEDILNIFNQLMLAGLDTVKSALSYSLLHLATHAADRRRIVAEPSIVPTAIEEFLRAFPLVLEGRKLGQDIDFHGATMRAGEMVMLALPAIMRDPDQFECPDDVIIDRANNNHLSFGGGPHRCLGSHLARMEMAVGLEEWHRRIPEYGLACAVDEVIERGGQLSLRSLPLTWDT
jgi:cytochrome P450